MTDHPLPSRLRLGLLGAGPAGRGALPALLGTGLADLAWVADPAHAGEALAGQTILSAAPLPLDGELIVLAVPEPALPDVIARLAEQLAREGARERLVVQLSASSPLELLEPLRAAGACAGLLHPLQTFPPGAPPAETIPYWALGGDARLRQRLAPLMGRLADEWFWLEPGQQLPYHLCAVLASNFLPAMMSVCGGLWPGEPAQAWRALQPIVEQTLRNLAGRAPAAAVSGPAARGDLETLARHLDWLRRERPDLVAMYDRLSEEILTLRGTASPSLAPA